ncbi:Sec63-domain-containing protein [Suillus hirtellus]|nr:Sec63-domain-containing protein [Suillus hirtellus]
MLTLELFWVFALSNEFKLLPVRQEENLELGKLLECVPIPVKEGINEPAAKINILLQAYISQLKLDGFALVADIVFVQQSASHILCAMFEICLKRGWAVPAWGSMTPLHQFKGVPQEVIRKAEVKQFPWYHYFDLNPPEIVEDVNREIVLFNDSFVLRQHYAEDEHNITTMVPMFEPIPPNYYISVVSDQWLHAETRLPISFKHLILPEKSPPPTPLLELQPLLLSALHNKDFKSIYSSTIQTFNKIQMQVFQALYTSDENVFIGAPTGSGKTICAEFALLCLWSKHEQPRAVCIEPYQEMVDQYVAEWHWKFSGLQGGKEIWDILSRRWQQCKNVQNFSLLIADEIQLVGGEVGLTYKVVISRTCYVAVQTEVKTCIVGCGVSLANARDLSEWMGTPLHAIFNFSPSLRTLDMDIHLQSFTIPHFPSLMIAMSKPAYLSIIEHSPTKPVIIFVPSRRQCQLMVDDLLIHCRADSDPNCFLNIEEADLQPHLTHISDKGLVKCLKHGVGYHHEALDKQDKHIVKHLFQSGAVQVLVASKDTAWSLPVASYMVIIMGMQYYEGKEHRYVNYPVMDILQMIDHLSELVENTLQDLVNSKCISIEDEMNISALNLRMIAAYYGISYVTVEVYTLSLKKWTKLKGLLEVVASSTEFKSIPIRRHEDTILCRIYDRVPIKLNHADFKAPHFKTFLLLQAHFSHIQLPPDLVADQILVLEKVLNLLSACVDVMSLNAWLNALGAMDLSQMCVQAMWETNSPLKQIHYFEPETIKHCKDAGIVSVYDVRRWKMINAPNFCKWMVIKSTFVNSYPTLGMSFKLEKGEYTAGAPITMQVSLARNVDDEDSNDQTLVAPFYLMKKIANWWLVVGEPSTKQLLSIKRVTITKNLSVKLEFTLPKGKHALKLYVICDAYVGTDHDLSLEPIDVVEGKDSDSDDESGDEMEE